MTALTHNFRVYADVAGRTLAVLCGTSIARLDVTWPTWLGMTMLCCLALATGASMLELPKTAMTPQESQRVAYWRYRAPFCAFLLAVAVSFFRIWYYT